MSSRHNHIRLRANSRIRPGHTPVNPKIALSAGETLSARPIGKAGSILSTCSSRFQASPDVGAPIICLLARRREVAKPVFFGCVGRQNEAIIKMTQQLRPRGNVTRGLT